MNTEVKDLSSLLIFQFSDLHYGADRTASRSKAAAYMINHEVCSKVQAEIEHYSPTCVLLVLNGDYVNNTSFRGVDPEDQILKSFEVLVEPIEKRIHQLKKTHKFDLHKFAVPGNHDIRRLEKDDSQNIVVELDEDRIKPFEEAFQTINSDEKRKDIPFMLPSDGPFAIPGYRPETLIWPIDTSFRCGSPDPFKGYENDYEGLPQDSEFLIKRRKLDLIRVSQNSIKECKKFIDKHCKDEYESLRIAIAHHSPISATLREDAHIFEDEGEFTNFLRDHRFQFLLHGHNHETSIIPAGEDHSMDFDKVGRDLEKPSHTLPLIESITKYLGARSLWPEDEAERGFNIIALNKINDSYMFDVEVKEVSISSDRLQSRTRQRTSKTSGVKFDIPTKSLDVLQDTQARRESLQRLLRKIYSNTQVSEFDDDAKMSCAAIRNLSKSRNALLKFERAYAGYAINNINPGDWLNTGFRESIEPYAQVNLLRACKYAYKMFPELSKGLEEKYDFKLPIFRLSKWLCEAIERSCQHQASIFGESSLIDEVRMHSSEELGKIGFSNDFSSEAYNYIKKTIRRYENISDHDHLVSNHSMSFWAPTIEGRHFLFEEIENENDITEIKENSITDMMDVDDFFEFPRLLLWRPDHFLSHSAFTIIRFHETNGIPLFWLHPDRLKSSCGVVRSDIGSSEYFGHLKDGSFTNIISLNNRYGEHPTSNCFNVDDPFAVSLPSRIWGLDYNGYRSLAPKSFDRSSPAQEFKVLLERPDLLMASDAWWLIHCLGVDKLEKHLSQKDNEIEEWLVT